MTSGFVCCRDTVWSVIIGLYELTECESHRVIEYTALVDATIVSWKAIRIWPHSFWVSSEYSAFFKSIQALLTQEQSALTPLTKRPLSAHCWSGLVYNCSPAFVCNSAHPKGILEHCHWLNQWQTLPSKGIIQSQLPMPSFLMACPMWSAALSILLQEHIKCGEISEYWLSCNAPCTQVWRSKLGIPVLVHSVLTNASDAEAYVQMLFCIYCPYWRVLQADNLMQGSMATRSEKSPYMVDPLPVWEVDDRSPLQCCVNSGKMSKTLDNTIVPLWVDRTYVWHWVLVDEMDSRNTESGAIGSATCHVRFTCPQVKILTCGQVIL